MFDRDGAGTIDVWFGSCVWSRTHHDLRATWASELSGTPVELIDRFADILSCKNNVAIHSANAASRCKGAENMLTDSTHSTTPHLNAWNSNLCQYEKYEGPIEVLPDYLMDPIIPIAD
ncbi:MAG: hypothetical protein ACI362_02830 [Coriobacteriales bacterium]